MPAGYESLQVLRVNKVMSALQDVRDIPQQLTFLNRTSVVPSVDGEIMGRWIGRIQIADLIADDAKAVVYPAGKFSLESSSPPNLKHGVAFSQSEINQLLALEGASAMNGGLNASMAKTMLMQRVDGLLLGVRQRMEALIIAMHLDSFSYNRLGVVLNGATWGMPSDLNVTPTYPWTDTVNADPVTDILTMLLVARERYGVYYDRVRMSTASFRAMIATASFIKRAQSTVSLAINYTQVPQVKLDYQQAVAANLLGCHIELYDARYWTYNASRIPVSVPFLPLNKVIIDTAGNDNNPTVQDFANGVVTETLLSSFGGDGASTASGMIGRFDQGQVGPVSYCTMPSDLNPPSITAWGVARGFPRKYLLQANAVLTVGTITDPIAITEPF
jgi:hypothetical protein